MNHGVSRGDGQREVLGPKWAPHNGSAPDNVINDIMGSAQGTLTWETGLLVDSSETCEVGFCQEKPFLSLCAPTANYFRAIGHLVPY